MQLCAAGEKHGVDLTKKKPIIKATAIRYCQEHAEAQEDDAAEEEEKADEEEDKAAVAVDGDVIAPVEEVYLHDDYHSNLRSMNLGSCILLHIGKLPSVGIATMQDAKPDEKEPVAADADTQPAADANGDKGHTEAPAAEGGANEDGAAKEAEQFDSAQKAALAAGNGTKIMSSRLGCSSSMKRCLADV